MSDCDAVADALCEGESLDAALRAHAVDCARCRALSTADDALGAMLNADVADGGAMPDALRSVIASERSHVAPFSTWRRAAVPLAVAVALAAAGLAFAPRADLHHRPRAAFAASAVVLAALVASGIVASLRRGRRGLGVRLGARVLYVVGALAMAEGAVAQVSRAVEGSVVLAPGDVARGLAHCASIGSALALVVGVALFGVARRTAITAPSATGAVAGAAAGLAGTLTLHLICPIASLEHAMIGHASPVLAGVVAGALLGRRVLSI